MVCRGGLVSILTETSVVITMSLFVTYSADINCFLPAGSHFDRISHSIIYVGVKTLGQLKVRAFQQRQCIYCVEFWHSLNSVQ